MAKEKKAKAPAAPVQPEEAIKAPDEGVEKKSIGEAAKEAAAAKRAEQNARLVYPSPKTAREETVFRWLQDTLVAAGGSMSWGDLRDKMLKEYTPKTSKNFDESYCQAYVRGGVQEGYLTLDSKHGVTELTVIEKKAQKAKEPSIAGTVVLNKMKTLTPASAHLQGEPTISVSDLVDALKGTSVKSAKSIAKTLEGLISCNLVFKRGEGDDLRYGLTDEGWKKGVEEPDEVEETEGESASA